MGIYLNPGNDAFASIPIRFWEQQESLHVSADQDVSESLMPQKCWRLIIQKVLIQIPFFKI